MSKPILYNQSKKDCCGCAACEAVCPVEAIKMIPDSEGFRYPSININKCIGCKKCEKTCAFKTKNVNNRESTIKDQYAIKYKNEVIRAKSQAGGSFAALAISLLEHFEQVSIYGAAYSEVYKVKHIRIMKLSEISRLQGSKYIQSEMSNVHKQIADDLRNGYVVMFAGTPCQNHSVKQYLKVLEIPTINFYSMDFICEGVASPLVWEKYLESVEKRFKSTVEEVVFRNKKYGWVGHYETIKLKNHKKLLIGRKWTNPFCSSLFFRESCHNCRYTSLNRESDITVSWFGNVDRKKPDFYDENGVSGIMINTEKGMRWFESIKNNIALIPVEMDDLMQNQLKKPIEKAKNRDDFWKDFNECDTWEVLTKYDSQKTLKKRVVRLIKNIIQKELKWI